MLSSQIDYYKALPEEDKVILQAAALECIFAIPYDLQYVIEKFFNLRINYYKFSTVINDAVKHNLFEANRSISQYTVSVDFLIYILPAINLSPAMAEKFNISGSQNTFYCYSIKLLRNCLFTLLYLPDKYATTEKALLNFHSIRFIEYYSVILEDEQYDKYLNRISREVIVQVTNFMLKKSIKNLLPMSEVHAKIKKIESLSNHQDILDDSNFQYMELFYSGKINELLSHIEQETEYEAIKFLFEGKINESLASFTYFTKEASKNGIKSPLPFDDETNYFYLIVLLLSDSKIALPVFQKIVKYEAKNNHIDFYSLFAAIALEALNERDERLSSFKETLVKSILQDNICSNTLIDILIYYLAGERPAENKAARVFNIIKKAVDAGNLLMGYEAAFVASKWFNIQRINDIYQGLNRKLNYFPAIARIERKEEWEKSLFLLFGIKTKTATKNKEMIENKARIVYYFNPKTLTLRPVLQKRLAKGCYKNRFIAPETYLSLDLNGITEQDIRMSKHARFMIKQPNNFYPFDKKVFVEMIGHPCIFLENSIDIPVEFVAAQPIVFVNKVSKGYLVVTNPKTANEPVFIEKETNTRYKVFNLTPNQTRIIDIINQSEMIIPESSRDKLTELFGLFSAEGMVVHSDLVAADAKVTELPADSRIRVQLLPYGEGLKTELFSKPFGDRPPYCKPGKGGKILISNEKNVQWQVKRDLQLEAENEQIILNDIQSLKSLNVTNELMSFDDPLDSLSLLELLGNRLDICVVEWPEGEKFKLRGYVTISNLNLKITSGINWFDLQGELQVDEKTVLTLQQLLRLTTKSHNRFIELSTGEFLALSERLKKQLDNLRLFSSEDKEAVHLNKFAFVGLGDFFDEMENVQADNVWKDFRRQIDASNLENVPVPAALKAELRAYQDDGFRWLARLAAWNAGACLADDMGLGKTVQALAVLLHRASLGAALVVCPVSVVSNWISEVEKFAPTLRLKTFKHNTISRQDILQSLEAGEVLVTSYGLLQSEEKLFADTEFATIILDEAHVIKNFATKTSKATMQLKAGFRMALTGTPIQNHLGEIWNLFNFINPGLLGSLQHFTDTFVKSDNSLTRKHLKKMIKPFILRRTKTEVLEELPPKTEIVKKIQLSDEEMAFYEALRRQALENLSHADESKHLQVVAEITRLRQASCNPLLIDPSITIPSTKLTTFLDIVGELIDNRHRALVFSQFVTHLSIVRQALDKQGITYQYLDGSSSQAERQCSVNDFQNGKGELFLISLKAGGLGLNLTAADYVIHLDPWWNPAVEDQASDRAHRIGQQRPVTIYRLVAENTIEEKIIQLHHLKRDLAEQLLEGSDMTARLSVHEMIALIREGADHRLDAAI